MSRSAAPDTGSRNHKLTCFECGQVNRTPESRIAGAKCGTCGAALAPARPVNVTYAALQKAVRNDSLPLVVDVWAPWCGPCRMMAPEYDKAAQTLQGRARLVKLNSDQEPKGSAAFGIRGIPTMIRFEKGREVNRSSGAVRAPDIERFAG